MSVFGLYAQYYDLLYRDKDYLGEAEYIAHLIRDFSPSASSILELGCGTGMHAAHLSEMGFEVLGIDMSEMMLDRARSRMTSQAPGLAERTSFVHGDVRTFRAGRMFDVVISLFHVFSYQTTNEDILAAFRTAANHLQPGGLLIFDYWYGPAVLTERPEIRVKRLENDQLSVLRIAEPTMCTEENRVTVNYTVLMDSKQGDRSEQVSESHDMRYLFFPEIEALASPWFSSESHCAWMTRRSPGLCDWAAVSVLKRKA